LDARDGRATARFDVNMKAPGRYRVKLLFPPHINRATNVPILIEAPGLALRATVNQRQPAVWLGPYDLPAAFTVSITNQRTNGFVAVDGLQVAPVDSN
ncbi:MAG TPA: hypothetical protein DCY80_19010, partial [Solibacterales bacterium]|nr:hypothetical protein [Bryobacterales bacterium]